MGPHPAVAAVRHAVRRSIAGLAPGSLLLVACSGGADSLALAAATAFEAPRARLRAGGVIIDHGLQPESAAVAGKVAATLTGLGLDPVLCIPVQVGGPGGAGPYPGLEGAARAARYSALGEAAAATGAAAVLLGHTLDDQAETVLLGLARGSGARSLAGMPGSAGRYRRPLLELRRNQTRAACAAAGLLPWQDPQNDDPAFARVRVRNGVLPVLEAALGPGVAEALARTARQLRADTDVLDQLATEAATQIRAAADPAAPSGGWPAADLARLPAAIRYRVLRAAALAAGCPAGALAERHILSVDQLITDWHGQRWTDLPGGVRCQRRYGRLLFTAAGVPGVAPHASAAPRSEDPGGRE